MCGIIAVVRRPSDRPVPDQHDILAGIERAAGLMPETPDGWPEGFGQAAGLLAEVDGLLRGLPGLRCLLADPGGRRELDRLAEELERRVERLESRIDAEPASVSPDALEAVNASLVRAKDSLWAIRRDRIASAEAVAAFAGPTPSLAVVETFTSIQIALAALDRLEVRGRDSAGVHVLVTGHRLDLDQPEIARLLDPRLRDPLFTSWALRTPAGHLSFVYKAASEVGELGDNGRRLRAAIAGDELLRRALQAAGAAPRPGPRAGRGVPAHGDRVRGLVRHRRADCHRPGPAAARRARQRPGPLCRPGRGCLPGGQRALWPGGRDLAVPADGRGGDRGRGRRRRRREGPDRGAGPGWRRHDRGYPAAGPPERRAAARRGRPAPRGDHHARHRPRTVPALPVEGDLGSALLVPQDPARPHPRGGRAPRHQPRSGGPPGRAARASRRRRDPAGVRDRPGHRGHRRTGCGRRHGGGP